MSIRLPVPKYDKATHAIYGYATFVAVAFLLGRQPWLAALAEWRHPIALALSVLAGVLVEVRQKQLNDAHVAAGEAPTHGIERSDVAATSVGGLAAWLAALV